MKKILFVLLLVITLSGCHSEDIKYTNPLDYIFESPIVHLISIIALIYFLTRVNNTYKYKGHTIICATRFLRCYLKIDGKKIAKDTFLNMGAEINITYEDLKIIAVFRRGFIWPITTLIINGVSLKKVSKYAIKRKNK